MLLLIWVLLLAGCVTSGLYRSDGERYSEAVEQIMVSSDGAWFVVLADSYHYVFPMTEGLSATFSSGFHRQVRASFDSFTVKRSNRITGRYQLTLAADASEVDQAAALAAGYRRDDGNIVYQGRVRGRRYAAGGFELEHTARLQPLNRRYYITVTESLSPEVLAARTLVTPLAVMADGAIVLFSIPLVVLVGTDIAINGMPALHSQ
ncbi:hypothetical protein [Halopseudomonas maritima]|uniref:hypothetical protein n=1 Tax=Halopseudomonas maritima TaxID=2918528 RepID=UPI001EECA0C4|nr:hypothetical protein [Halopseudomonas maritima]UJJ31987.1 hypothetical protein HV822_02125 [Halopseudomonas maritima]